MSTTEDNLVSTRTVDPSPKPDRVDLQSMIQPIADQSKVSIESYNFHKYEVADSEETTIHHQTVRMTIVVAKLGRFRKLVEGLSKENELWSITRVDLRAKTNEKGRVAGWIEVSSFIESDASGSWFASSDDIPRRFTRSPVDVQDFLTDIFSFAHKDSEFELIRLEIDTARETGRLLGNSRDLKAIEQLAADLSAHPSIETFTLEKISDNKIATGESGVFFEFTMKLVPR